MVCVLRRRWRPTARALRNPSLRADALDLIDRRAPAVTGADHDTWLAIDRPFLQELSVGARKSDRDLVQLWLATMLWGYSIDNRGPARVAVAMDRSCRDFTSKLRASLDRIDAGQFVDAYRGNQSRGRSYLPKVGDSYFTKWFWAAGLGNPQLPLTLLIWDRRVATSAKGRAWQLKGQNDAERYVFYCELVGQVAAMQGVTPEQVEYGLYCSG